MERDIATRSKTRQFTYSLLHEAAVLEVGEAEYDSLDRELAKLVLRLMKLADLIVVNDPSLSEEQRRGLARVCDTLIAIVKEDLAEIVADWEDGMTYEKFSIRFDAAKRRWTGTML